MIISNLIFIISQVMESSSFNYPECKKGGFHVGEALNIVCLQPKCLQKSIICAICYDQQHQNHKIRPLKLIIDKSKKYLLKLKPISLDSNKIKETIQTSENQLMQKYLQFQKHIHATLSGIKDSITSAHIKMIEQVDLKTGSSEQMIQTLNNLSNNNVDFDVFMKSMQKLLAGVPLEKQDQQQQTSEATQAEVQKAVISLKKKLEKQFDKKSQTIKTDLKKYLQLLQKISQNPYIFGGKIQFKFSSELHHGGVNVISDTLIKSTQGYNYHFALMEPSLQEKGNKAQSVEFKIKENTSSWLAIGICHKNTVVTNGYNFNYSHLGHGAYLISANGGSWSSINSSHNNVVTAFNFYKDDIIIVSYDPTASKVIFKKKNSDQTHQIDFETKNDDQLHLCGLFYYQNDEIEYLGPSDA